MWEPLADPEDCEHEVYICGWSKAADGFVVWLKEHPHVRAGAPDYAAAEEALIEAIHDAGGAMHAVLEFDPQLPKSDIEFKYSNPEVYLICGDDRFEAAAPPAPAWDEYWTPRERKRQFEWADAFFQSAICRSCGYASDPRREKKRLPLSYTPRRYDGGFGRAGAAANLLQIVSEDFLELLTEEERRSLAFRPVVSPDEDRQFYELAGPAGVPLIAVAGMEIIGWRCATCGHRTWGHRTDRMPIDSFVAKPDLPSPLPSMFTVGEPGGEPGLRLCVTAERWKGLVGRRGTRGFVSRLLGVAPDDKVIRLPDLPTREEAEMRFRSEP